MKDIKMLNFGAGLVLISAVVSVGVGVGPVQAAPPPDGAATIVRGADCKMRTDPQDLRSIRTTDMQAVITPSGRINLVCHGRVPRGTVTPFHKSGFPCLIGLDDPTTDSHVVWNAAGNGTLTCHGQS
jgi:hypothetical protein